MLQIYGPKLRGVFFLLRAMEMDTGYFDRMLMRIYWDFMRNQPISSRYFSVVFFIRDGIRK